MEREEGWGVIAAPALLLALIHASAPRPLPGHPEAMKMSCRQGYFHTCAWKDEASEVRPCSQKLRKKALALSQFIGNSSARG